MLSGVKEQRLKVLCAVPGLHLRDAALNAGLPPVLSFAERREEAAVRQGRRDGWGMEVCSARPPRIPYQNSSLPKKGLETWPWHFLLRCKGWTGKGPASADSE